jgi:hypothetical protein
MWQNVNNPRCNRGKKTNPLMSKSVRILNYTFAISLIALFACSGCVSAKKNYVYSKNKESLCDFSRLGKNKYFYSGTYQRKLRLSNKKIALH